MSAVGIFNNPDVVEPAQNERNEAIHNDEMVSVKSFNIINMFRFVIWS